MKIWGERSLTRFIRSLDASKHADVSTGAQELQGFSSDSYEVGIDGLPLWPLAE